VCHRRGHAHAGRLIDAPQEAHQRCHALLVGKCRRAADVTDAGITPQRKLLVQLCCAREPASRRRGGWVGGRAVVTLRIRRRSWRHGGERIALRAGQHLVTNEDAG
jgi:hypothetical protein